VIQVNGSSMMLAKIISGGQTGADRAALDAGTESGFPIGGSCPAGRMAEDGPIDLAYPLVETEGGYESRTRKNVEDSDGTVVFFKGYLHGGTEKTVAFCKELAKPHTMVDIELVPADVAVDKVLSFVADYKIRVLNVAGPRQSHCPSIYTYVKHTMRSLLAKST
jgi:hypothetical protein